MMFADGESFRVCELEKLVTQSWNPLNRTSEPPGRSGTFESGWGETLKERLMLAAQPL
jgi:hypothetical protein